MKTTHPPLGGAGANRTVSVVPAANRHGVARITLSVSDGNGGMASDSFQLTVNAVNDPPVAGNPARHAPAIGQTVPVFVAATHASDPDGDPVSITNASHSGSGTVAFDSAQVTYTNTAPGFTGMETVTVSLGDGHGGVTTAVATLTNQVPVANNDAAVAYGIAPATVAVLGNDNDPDNDSLAITAVTQGGHGVVTVDGTNMIYTAGVTTAVSDSFGYTVTDGHGGRSSATVAVTLRTDAGPPTLELATPAASQRVAGSEVVFKGRARDDGSVNRVEVALDGGAPLVAAAPAGTADFSWQIPAAPETGLHTLVARAYDSAGNASVSISRTFTFIHLRPQFEGAYNGLLLADAADSTPLDHHGLVAIQVTPTGAFSGKVTLSAVTLPFTGVFRNGGEARFGRDLAPALELVKTAERVKISLGHLALTLDTGGGDRITGTLQDATGAATYARILHADRALYTARKNPAPPLRNIPIALLDPAQEKGRYTALFHAHANGGAATTSFPQGTGCAFVRIMDSGDVRIVGKLADKSIFSYANALSRANEWPVFIPLYARKGFVTGNVTFDPTQLNTDAAGAGMRWFKPAALPRQTLYPNGWPNGIVTDFAASKYLAPTKPTVKVPAPPNPGTVLGPGVLGAPNATTANIVLTTDAGGLALGTLNQASLDAKSKITVLGTIPGATAAVDLKAAFVAPTGAMTGSFTHPGTGNAVNIVGVAFQKTNTASGYFLYFPPKNAPPGTPTESGAVFVQQLP